MDIPKIGLGTWQLTGAECTRVVREALELGYTHIDTATMYRNHRAIGEAIRGHDRKDLYIVSKVLGSHLKHDEVIYSCNEALEELGTDYLDLYLIHYPNPAVPLAETLGAFKELQRQGRIKHIGVSNFSAAQMEEALRITPIICNQVEFHPHNYDRELLDFCKRHGIALVAYSPLGRGRATQDKTIREIAKRHGRTPGQVTLRWILDKGAIVIPKASSREHLKENLELDFKLTPQETAQIDNL